MGEGRKLSGKCLRICDPFTRVPGKIRLLETSRQEVPEQKSTVDLKKTLINNQKKGGKMGSNRFNGPFRQSLLKLYSQCPRKFKLLKVDGIEVPEEKAGPLMRGSLVHKILNDFHREGSVDLARYDIPEDISKDVCELVEAYVQHLSLIHI